MTTLDPQIESQRSQEEELARLRAEVAAWRKRFDASEHARPRVRELRRRSRAAVHGARRRAATADKSLPGSFPYTRGIHPTGYRGKLWTMRQFAGFGSAHDTNARYKFLLEHGQTGLSVAFDFPTLMGYDSDHPRSEGEVGKCGVAISSLADMETLFDGIPLDKVSTSMTINGPAIILYCFYIAAAEKQGVDASKLQRHDPERHPEGVHGAARVVSIPSSPRCGSSSTASSGARSTRRSGTRSRSPATTFARRDRPPRRSSRSRSPTASPTSSAASRAASTSMTSRRGSRSSGTSTTISSRRSRSCAPRAASGRATCASATARRTRARGRCASTRRRPA